MVEKIDSKKIVEDAFEKTKRSMNSRPVIVRREISFSPVESFTNLRKGIGSIKVRKKKSSSFRKKILSFSEKKKLLGGEDAYGSFR